LYGADIALARRKISPAGRNEQKVIWIFRSLAGSPTCKIAKIVSFFNISVHFHNTFLLFSANIQPEIFIIQPYTKKQKK